MRIPTPLRALAVAGALTLGAGAAAAATVYVANEVTNTVSVIDAATGTLVATICLGSDPPIPGTPQPAGPCNGEAQHHAPFYNGHVGVHGLWLTPDGGVLVVAARISGTVVAVDTRTRAVLGYAPVGREPHLATVRPGGREAWVAVRGESHLEVLGLDPAVLRSDRPRSERLPRLAVIPTVRGPSMVAFTRDGRTAFVAAGKEPRVAKLDADARREVASAPVPAAFTPFALVTPDDRELYLVHKGLGRLSVLRTDDLAPAGPPIEVGPCANHVWFVGRLAYVTIGGPPPCAPAGNPAREGKVVILDRATRTIVRELTGPAFTGDPHGIWGTPDGRRLFIGHESGHRVTIVDTGAPDDPADDAVVGTVQGPAEAAALMKQPIDVVVAP